MADAVPSSSSRFGGSSNSRGEVGSTLQTGDGRSRSRPPHLIAHTGIDWEVYRQPYLAYRDEEHFRSALRAPRAEALARESRRSRAWRCACQAAGSVWAHVPGTATRSSVKLVGEHL
mmetsp:Transcript_18923/g.56976  ORF Transcript_18923/g.56976 Transcript_18923/m.56976 type:complete len:117 (+) Transcript_18923:145-495(+)